MLRTSGNRGGGGRFRVTDDTVVTVGTDVQVRAEHVTALNATKKKESADETRRGHRRRLKKMMYWWMTEYPDYFEVGTRVLTEEEKADPMKFFHTCDRDIISEGLRVEMVLAYMAATKKKIVAQSTLTHTCILRFMMPYSSVPGLLSRYCPQHTILNWTLFWLLLRKRWLTLGVMAIWMRRVLTLSVSPSFE